MVCLGNSGILLNKRIITLFVKRLIEKFKSRSFKSFQEALERGEKGAKNFPVFNANEKLRKGDKEGRYSLHAT